MIALALRSLFAAVALLAIGMPSGASAQTQAAMASEPRVALVIGNSAYKTAPLKNPGNDADDVAQALRSLNFRVTLLKDAGNRRMIEAINAFGQELRNGGVGLFFFAGHGVQSRGRNYLIPVGAEIASEDQLEFESVDATRVLAAMDNAANRVNILILDACRDNPYARSFRNTSRGLAQMDAARGSFIAFSTAPGQMAADGTGRNGLYTQHLLQSLKQADSDIDKVFRRVTADVSRASSGKQVPWISHSLTGDFYFRLELKVPASALGAAVGDTAVELAFWDTIKSSANRADFEEYLRQYPDGRFAGLARNRVNSLSSQLPALVATIAPSTPATIPSPAATLADGLQGARAKAGPFDGRWEGQSDVWHVNAVVENGRIKGIVRCFRLLADKNWSGWGPTFDVILLADGKVDTRLAPQSGWAERRITGSFPNLSVTAREDKLQCPNGQVSLRRSE